MRIQSILIQATLCCLIIYCIRIIQKQPLNALNGLPKPSQQDVDSQYLHKKGVALKSVYPVELSKNLSSHHTALIVKKKFDIDQLSSHLFEIDQAISERRKYEQNSRRMVRSVIMMVLSSAQRCLFDNLISSLVAIEVSATETITSSMFPPIVVFNLDHQSNTFCNYLVSVSSSNQISITCIPPKDDDDKDSSLTSGPHVVEYGDISYREAVWLKPMLLALLLRSQLFDVSIVVDVDIVFFKPFNVHDDVSLHTSHEEKARGIQAACEIDNDIATVNTGFLIVRQQARDAIDLWTSVTRFPPPMDDQASFRQKISRNSKLRELVQCLPHNLIKLSCMCEDPSFVYDGSTTSSCIFQSKDILALHCTEVPNKTLALDVIGLWKPSILSHGDCAYGVSEKWWQTHPKQKDYWKHT